MGLFRPKISKLELECVNQLLKKANESANIINKTTQPDVFFRRLCFLLHFLLELQKYERYKIFKGNTPSNDFKNIINNLEKTVDDFIERSYTQATIKSSTYKTDKARQKHLKDYAIKIICAFENPHQFNDVYGATKYTGALFTENNYEKVKQIVSTIDKFILEE